MVNRIDSGKFLINELPDAVFVSGEVKTKDRKEEYDEIVKINPGFGIDEQDWVQHKLFMKKLFKPKIDVVDFNENSEEI